VISVKANKLLLKRIESKTARRHSERGCVEDQPQHAASSSVPKNSNLLRLVEDDTAAPRGYQTGSEGLNQSETIN